MSVLVEILTDAHESRCIFPDIGAGVCVNASPGPLKGKTKLKLGGS